MIILWVKERKPQSTIILTQSFIYTAKGKGAVGGNSRVKYTRPHAVVLTLDG